jgi:hypothetical protein
MGWNISFTRVPPDTAVSKIEDAAPMEGGKPFWQIQLPEGVEWGQTAIASREEILAFLTEEWGATLDPMGTPQWERGHESLAFCLQEDPVTWLGTDNHATLDTLVDLRRRLNAKWPLILFFEDSTATLHDDDTLRKFCEMGRE